MKKISIACPAFFGNEKQYLNECIDTGWVSANGRFIQEFEEKFAHFCGSRFALSCANGTVSLHLILVALGVGPGDEVIMPTLTYIATANAVRYCGATPVFVDSEENTFNIDPKKIEEKITKHTKAIMPVHLYGLCADMDKIMRIAQKHKLCVIEDAAEAHGATIAGKKSGSLGHVASFSFFGNKIITTGEGGMVTTDDEDLYHRMKLFKGQGMDPNRRYWHTVIGYNYRMTNLQAALGLGQLETIEQHLGHRARVAKQYHKNLSAHSDVLRMQACPPGFGHVYWMNNVVLSSSVELDRDDVMRRLAKDGIETRPVFYPVHTMPPHFVRGSFPVSEHLASRGISLPSHSGLTNEDIEYICTSLTRIVGIK